MNYARTAHSIKLKSCTHVEYATLSSNQFRIWVKSIENQKLLYYTHLKIIMNNPTRAKQLYTVAFLPTRLLIVRYCSRSGGTIKELRMMGVNEWIINEQSEMSDRWDGISSRWVKEDDEEYLAGEEEKNSLSFNY